MAAEIAANSFFFFIFFNDVLSNRPGRASFGS
jgi:hypothetical protein